MTRFLPKLALALALGFAAGALGLTADAADDPKPDEKKPAEKVEKADKAAEPKAPDWSHFSNYGDPVTGTVVKADENGITVQLPKLALTRGYNRNRQPGVKVQHEDVTIKYADGALARWKKLPPKIGADGKKSVYTDKEMSAMQKPIGVPGYLAEKTDVQKGLEVELHLVRPKSVSADKVTREDLLIKYAMILGQSATPPAEKNDGKAKKNNNN
jgi:hypothetical protein